MPASVASKLTPAGAALPRSLLPRLQLFEFHELKWFPESFRNAITEVLAAMSAQFRVHDAIQPIIEAVLEASRSQQIVDLCSGAGGPVLAMEESLARHDRATPVLLTDRFPNAPAFLAAERASSGHVKGIAEPVDATAVPEHLTGVRTLFNAFHHFPPALARGIAADACRRGQPLALFEITERSLFNTLSIFFLSFLMMLWLLPKMKNRRPEWWIFTYLIPILPIAFGWDGFVSCLRSYTATEMDELTAGLPGGGKHFSGRLRMPGWCTIRVTYHCFIPDYALQSLNRGIPAPEKDKDRNPRELHEFRP